MAPAWYMVGVTAIGLIALILMPESAPSRMTSKPLLAPQPAV